MNMSMLGKFADTAKSLGAVLDNILNTMEKQLEIQEKIIIKLDELCLKEKPKTPSSSPEE